MATPRTPAPGPAPRNGRHTRDDVARTALRLLDEHGLPELTMRRLAAALEVQPSALYWHFENKQTLLAELADRIASRGLVRPGEQGEHGENGNAREQGEHGEHGEHGDWMIATATEAQSLRDALLTYRDGAEVVSSSYALGLGESVPLARLAAALERAPFDPQTVGRASAALLHFILGHVSHEQQRLQYDSLGVAVGAETTAESAAESAAAFAFGVRLLLVGLAAEAALPAAQATLPA